MENQSQLPKYPLLEEILEILGLTHDQNRRCRTSCGVHLPSLRRSYNKEPDPEGGLSGMAYGCKRHRRRACDHMRSDSEQNTQRLVPATGCPARTRLCRCVPMTLLSRHRQTPPGNTVLQKSSMRPLS